MTQTLAQATQNAQRRLRLAKRALLGLVVAGVVLFAACLVVLPLVVSTDRLKSNIESTLSILTGMTATIDSVPELDLWPSPSLLMQGLTLRKGNEVLLQAPVVTAGFSLIQTLLDRPAIRHFRLVQPAIRVAFDKDGVLNWPKADWMAQARVEATETDHSGDLQRLAEIEIADGTLTISSAGIERQVTGLAGTLSWPGPGQPLLADLSAFVQGQSASLAFRCDQPWLLWSGGSAGFEATVSVASLVARFEGAGSLSANRYMSGRLRLDIASPAELARWSGLPDVLPDAVGAVGLDATLATAGMAMKLDGLSLSVGEASASGVLDLDLGQVTPRLAGTLAIDRLEIAGPGDPAPLGAVQRWLGLLQSARLDADLRLSLAEAVFGDVSVTGIAAGLQVENGTTTLDIGDGSVAGGTLSGHAAMGGAQGAGGSKAQVSLKAADLGLVAAALGLTGPLPDATGTIQLDLTTRGDLSTARAETMEGTLSLVADRGAIEEFSVADFQALMAARRFFNLSEVAGDRLAFDTMEIDARFSGGVAELTRAEIAGPEGRLTLAGIIPYRRGSLALTGTLMLPDATEAGPAAPLGFFVGGSWPDAVISAVP